MLKLFVSHFRKFILHGTYPSFPMTDEELVSRVLDRQYLVQRRINTVSGLQRENT